MRHFAHKPALPFRNHWSPQYLSLHLRARARWISVNSAIHHGIRRSRGRGDIRIRPDERGRENRFDRSRPSRHESAGSGKEDIRRRRYKESGVNGEEIEDRRGGEGGSRVNNARRREDAVGSSQPNASDYHGRNDGSTRSKGSNKRGGDRPLRMTGSKSGGRFRGDKEGRRPGERGDSPPLRRMVQGRHDQRPASRSQSYDRARGHDSEMAQRTRERPAVRYGPEDGDIKTYRMAQGSSRPRAIQHGSETTGRHFDSFASQRSNYGRPDARRELDESSTRYVRGRVAGDEDRPGRIISSPQRSNTAPTEVAKFGDKGSPTRNDDHYRRTHHASGTSKNLTLSSLTKRNTLVPLSIPYTTPASEFLYGTSVVRAALRSGRRKMYKLYVYEGDNREVIDRDLSLRKLARAAGADAIGVSGEWIRLMDKMSKGRPHNGYILEASPLPNLPATGLERITSPSFNFSVTLGHQSREEQAVNGTDNLIPYNNGSKNRFPFVLLLDGILDPGNLGAVLRTSFFLGVDAIAISARNSAPLTPTVLKASAGASEHIPLFSLSSPHNFLSGSSSAGWKIYAAVASSSSTSSPKEQSPIASSRSPKTTTSNTSSTSTNRPPITPYVLLSSLDAPLRHHPCILMLGSEGEGLSPRLRRKADVEVGIECGRSQNGGVDSLNVSVAAALLCQGFLSDVRPIGRAGLMGKKKKKKEQEQIIGEAEQEGETVEEVQGDKLF